MSMSTTRMRGLAAATPALALLGAVAFATPALAGGDLTAEDFFQQCTQPDPSWGTPDAPIEGLVDVIACSFCHGNYDPLAAPVDTWTPSMMAQAARDPVFHAGLSIARQDADGVAEYCVRCHAPVAFLSGNGDPGVNPDGTPAFTELEQEGIQCNFCHRMVDPVFKEGISPDEDVAILDALAMEDLLPPEGSNARYIIDPIDVRRGPFDDLPFNPHGGTPVIVSPFHNEAELCWNCHDVSNPVLSRDHADDTYSLNMPDTAHPTGSQDDMFPVHRTYSEWKNSYYFTANGVQHDGRFGGNHIDNPDYIADGTAGVMRTCQDCHMPDQLGEGCALGGFPTRQNIPQHSFLGSNTWVLRAILDLDTRGTSGLTQENVDAAIERNTLFLQAAATVTATTDGSNVNVRVLNHTGHKLPSGFPDGRRMWLNVKFLDDNDKVVAERGHYDFDTAELVEDTTIFEIKLGISEDHGAEVGQPAGPTQHFVLANEILKDNRIPPAGFSNSIAEAEQMAPVGTTYLDGQNWLDTPYAIPCFATKAMVTLYYQTTSKEFIEFLRDENVSDDTGQRAYDQWVLHGRSAPVTMGSVMIEFDPVNNNPFDITGDGIVGPADLAQLLENWGECPGCPADLNGDGDIGPPDLALLLENWDIGFGCE